MYELPNAAPATSARRRSVARALLIAGAIASMVGLLGSAMMLTDPDEVAPESLLIPMLFVYLFAFTWWAVAAALITGILLSVSVPNRQPLLVWGVVGMLAFVIAVALLASAGLFPWPFPPRLV
ncbi:hypothetical protein DC31_01330 [Microbacterium sp. CH12i]|uniref:hypothetical protein n=1 Tax=Microbacterium sp. CH12i TaxID=1479651 RepID=UPI00046200F8|nr:hypothetical protein [Microbacterium sp. CH12i]KDA07221.1 hypothetical protein DC31_01330 [Microbacterium sp. CH12i]